VRLCNHPRLLLPAEDTLKKQQNARHKSALQATAEEAADLFGQADDENVDEAFGYEKLFAHLPLPLQEQLQQQASAAVIALHGAKVSSCLSCIHFITQSMIVLDSCMSFCL
jgi:hypothetical protein